MSEVEEMFPKKRVLLYNTLGMDSSCQGNRRNLFSGNREDGVKIFTEILLRRKKGWVIGYFSRFDRGVA